MSISIPTRLSKFDVRSSNLYGARCAIAWWGFDIATLWAAFHAFGAHRDSTAEALIIITPGVERFDYFRHMARWREAREPREVLLGLQDRFDTPFHRERRLGRRPRRAIAGRPALTAAGCTSG